MPQNFYELVWIFIIYAFLGWCTEVAYAAVDTGKFVNRGFLNGPYCPIYGCGIVIVVSILTPIKDNLFVLFFGSLLLTTVLEFLTGFLLEKIFHNKWWDYSAYPFNIKGYVCLKFSLYWGLACTFVMDIIHPMIYKLISIMPFLAGVIILLVVMVIFTTDIVISVLTILKLNQRLKSMDDIAKRIHNISDEIGEKVYKNVSTVMDKSEEFQTSREDFLAKFEQNVQNIKSNLETRKDVLSEEYTKKMNEREELLKKYKELLSQKNFGIKRLMKAFPNMKSSKQNEVLQKYREHMMKKSLGEKYDKGN